MGWARLKTRLARDILICLYERGVVKTWYKDKPEGWVLTSGLWSPFYIQLRSITSHPDSRHLLTRIGRAMGKMIREEMPDVNRLVGVAMAGIPLAVAITMSSGIPSCYTRKLRGVKRVATLSQWIERYGEHSLVEGELADGDVLALVDDLVTKFDSKLVALEQIRYEAERRGLNITCRHVAVLIDREQGAAQVAKSHGVSLHSLIPFKSEGLGWLRDHMSDIEHTIITDYLQNSSKYQKGQIRRRLAQLARKGSQDRSKFTDV
jgi:orotate phosphoribosyltransferase